MYRLFCILILSLTAVRDIRTMEIPDISCAALLGTVIIWTPPGEIEASLPAALLVWICYLLSLAASSALKRPAPIGAGDIRLFSILALQLGTRGIMTLFAVSGLLAGAAAAVLLILKKVSAGSEIPFAPFIAAGYALMCSGLVRPGFL